jgi:UDP-N-acetylmuramoylalanine--D-glutamate ligase
MRPWAELLKQNIHVVGLAGTEGTAVVDFLLRHGAQRITAHDLCAPEQFASEFARTHVWIPAKDQAAAILRLTSPPVQVRYRDRYLEGIETAEIIFVSQAWFRHPENAPLCALRDQGRRFSSMTALFFEVSPAPICGVTGTNGKFTVAQLIYDMLRRSGIAAFFSGNDRSHVPMLYVADQIPAAGWLVLEISNRQLVDLPYSPQLAVITNIAPHHLDDHGTMEAYVETKRTILKHQRPDDRAVLNGDNLHTAALARTAMHPYLFSRTRRLRSGAYVDGDALVIDVERGGGRIPLRVLRIHAPHMVENALAAGLTATLAGASIEAITDVLAEFRGLPYRGRVVDEIGGVVYYEDSLATNPAAAAAGIASMQRPFVLIAGGIRRGARPEDFAPMRMALADAPIKAVVLIGAAAPILANMLADSPVPVTMAETLKRAVEVAHAAAQPGDAVLLSPGCESFDQFRDYRDRGDQFVRLVQELRVVKGNKC